MTLKRIAWAACTAAAALIAVPAMAQTAFDEIDQDSDDVLEDSELEHTFGPRAQAVLSKFDQNLDGVVTLNEVRASDDAQAGLRGRELAPGQRDRSAEEGKSKASERSTDRGGSKAGSGGNGGGNGSGGSGGGGNGGGGSGNGNGGGGGRR